MITAEEARKLMPNEDILNNYPEIEILIKDAAKLGIIKLNISYLVLILLFVKYQTL